MANCDIIKVPTIIIFFRSPLNVRGLGFLLPFMLTSIS
nr:MAG TPA: hypothetical protein [Caudoviricetes sp.]